MKQKYRNYLIMFLLLAVSGMPIFSGNDIIRVGVWGLFLLLVLFERDLRVDKELTIILGAAFTLVIFQALIFSFFKIDPVIGLVIWVTTGYLAVKLLRERFIDNFLDVMYFLSIFSFLIFIPILIKPELESIIVEALPSFLSYTYFEIGLGEVSKKSMILYEFNTQMMGDFGLLVRNCGPFWEPGAFGGYLIVAMIFNTVRQGHFFTKYNCVFLLAILSTQSTAAFIGLFVFVIAVYLVFRKFHPALKMMILTVLTAGTIFAFFNISFLNSKIKIESTDVAADMEEGGDSRLASAALDLEDIMRFPLTGRGMWDETRIDKRFEFVMRNNGVTNLMARWGILFGILYFFLYYKGFAEYCRLYGAKKHMALVMLGTILLIGMSQDYFESAFFFSLTFLAAAYRQVLLVDISQAQVVPLEEMSIAN